MLIVVSRGIRATTASASMLPEVSTGGEYSWDAYYLIRTMRGLVTRSAVHLVADSHRAPQGRRTMLPWSLSMPIFTRSSWLTSGREDWHSAPGMYRQGPDERSLLRQD